MKSSNIRINEKIFFLIKICEVMLLIQIIRICIVNTSFLFIEKTSFNNTLINFILMSIFTIIIIVWSKKNSENLSLIPNLNNNKNKIIYSISTVIIIFLIVSTPIFNKEYSIGIIVSLIFSTIITPVFEELLFRGFIWNQLKNYYKNELVIYMITTILFAIWHIGYFDSIILNMNAYNLTGNMLFVMLMKVLTGLIFGIIIGFVRYKTKNTYSAILTHSIMNVFGR